MRLAFLLRVDGLAFFFFLLSKAKGTLCLVSREKEKVEPMLREKLLSMPWLVTVSKVSEKSLKSLSKASQKSLKSLSKVSVY